MKTSRRSALFVGIAFLVGLSAGYLAAVKLAERSGTEMIHAMMLSHASLQTTETTMLLKVIREGKGDLATTRLEDLLNRAVIEIGHEYTPRRDYYGAAAKSLALANEYRAAHPYESSLPSTAREVKAALATKTSSPNTSEQK
jgi:hypothetical protein